MGKVSVDDKIRIQTLRKQGLGYRAIAAKYPELGADTLTRLQINGFCRVLNC